MGSEMCIRDSLYTSVANADSSGLLWPKALAEIHFNDEVERVSEVRTEDDVATQAANMAASTAANTANIIDLENHKSSNDGDYDQSGFDTGAEDKIAI